MSAALRLVYGRNRFDLDHGSGVVERLDLGDRVGRIGGLKKATTQRHHVLEMRHVSDEDRDLDHVLQAGATGFERTAQIEKGLLALSKKAARDDLSLVVSARLARDEEQIFELNALREQEGRVVVGLGCNMFQHDANYFIYGWPEN
jgi:hypothetical protein